MPAVKSINDAALSGSTGGGGVGVGDTMSATVQYTGDGAASQVINVFNASDVDLLWVEIMDAVASPVRILNKSKTMSAPANQMWMSEAAGGNGQPMNLWTSESGITFVANGNMQVEGSANELNVVYHVTAIGKKISPP